MSEYLSQVKHQTSPSSGKGQNTGAVKFGWVKGVYVSISKWIMLKIAEMLQMEIKCSWSKTSKK